MLSTANRCLPITSSVLDLAQNTGSKTGPIFVGQGRQYSLTKEGSIRLFVLEEKSMCKASICLCLLGLTLTVISCSSDRSNSPTSALLTGQAIDTISNNPIVLEFGETKILTAQNLEITFRSVIHDSRCPLEVDCFWPGMATIGLQIVQQSDSHLVAVSIHGGDPQITFPELLPVDTLGFRFALMQLMPYPGYPDPIPDSDYIATLTVFPFVPDNSIDGEVQISDLPPSSIQVDQFSLDTVSIRGNVIDLAVTYGGGCTVHEFSLFMSPAAFLESYPVQANLYLRHYANNDPCDAVISRRLLFDVRPIAHLYERWYGCSDPIMLNVYKYFESVPDEKLSVVYDPGGYVDTCRQGQFAGQWVKDAVFSSQGHFESELMSRDTVLIGYMHGNFSGNYDGTREFSGTIFNLNREHVIGRIEGSWYYDDPRMCPMCGEDHGQVRGRIIGLNGEVVGAIQGQFGYPEELAGTVLPFRGIWRHLCHR
jgi:hypothetical protein